MVVTHNDEPGRVLITGLGLVSSLGLDREEHLRRLHEGQCGLKASDAELSAAIPMAGEGAVAGLVPRRDLATRMLRKLLQPSAAFAVLASTQALADAGLQDESKAAKRRGSGAEPDTSNNNGHAGSAGPDCFDRDRCGLYVGSVSYDLPGTIFRPALEIATDSTGRFDGERFVRQGFGLIDPLLIVKGLPNAGLCGIAIEHRLRGPNLNIADGAASGLQAVAAGVAAIRRGEVEVALVGGYDSLLQPEHRAEHLLAGRLSPNNSLDQACRPFAPGRDGYTLGEGAAILILESESHARRRGATAYAEIVACAERTALDDDEMAGGALLSAARDVLGDGGELPQAVFGDGLGLEEDDRREALALQRLAGNGTQETALPFTASCAALGFTGAAAGAFSLAHASQALVDGRIPPTLGNEPLDPACKIDLVRLGRSVDARRLLVWSSDQGNKNVALLLAAPNLDTVQGDPAHADLGPDQDRGAVNP